MTLLPAQVVKFPVSDWVILHLKMNAVETVEAKGFGETAGPFHLNGPSSASNRHRMSYEMKSCHA